MPPPTAPIEPATPDAPPRRPAKWQRWIAIWPSIASVGLFLLLEAFRFAKIIKLPVQQLVGFVPDDAFYYLVLARNFAETHRWTFDRVAPATGFHPLWGYLLAGIYTLQPHITFLPLFVLLFWVSTLLAAAGLLLLCLVVTDKLGPYAVVGPLAVFLSSFVIYLPNELMEASFVLFFASAAVYLVSGRLSTRRLVAACACGFLGMLARSDFGMLPILLLVASVLLRSATWKLAAALFLGAVLGFAALIAHTEAISGHALQASTRVKRSWSQKDHDNIAFSVAHTVTPLVSGVMFPWPPTPLRKAVKRIALLASLLLLAWSLFKMRVPRPTAALIIAMVGVPIAYVYLYRFDSSAVMPWYSANFAVPYSILFALIVSFRVIVLRATATICLFALAAHGVLESFDPMWPSQEASLAAAAYITTHPDLGTVGAWNAGVLQYFSAGHIVNIDGLVNDDAAGFIVAGNLPAYLSKRQISTLIDDDLMLSTPYFRLRGGYPGDTLTRCIDQEQRIWVHHPSRGCCGDDTVIVKLNPRCLAR